MIHTKKIITIMSLILFSRQGLIGFAHAQTSDCQACHQTPDTIQTYITLAQTILTTLTQDTTDTTYSIAPMVGPFQGGSLNLTNLQELKQIYGSVASQKGKEQTFITNTTNLTQTTPHSTEKITEHVASWFSPTLQRDVQKIQEIDSAIAVAKAHIHTHNITYNTLQKETLSTIQKVIQKAQTDLLDDTSTIQPSASYEDVLIIIKNLQHNIKISLLETQDTTKETSKNGSSIALSSQATEALRTSYTCVKQKQCNANRNKFNHIAQAWKEGTQGTANATQEFVTGWKRLMFFFAIGSNTLDTKQLQQIQAQEDELRRKYNGYKSKSGTQRLRATYRNNFTKLIKTDEKDITKRTPKEPKIYNPTIKSVKPSTFGETLEKELTQFSTDTRYSHALLMASTSDDQAQNTAITAQTLIHIAQRIQNIEESLVTTCELQCSNKGGKCRATPQ